MGLYDQDQTANVDQEKQAHSLATGPATGGPMGSSPSPSWGVAAPAAAPTAPGGRAGLAQSLQRANTPAPDPRMMQSQAPAAAAQQNLNATQGAPMAAASPSLNSQSAYNAAALAEGRPMQPPPPAHPAQPANPGGNLAQGNAYGNIANQLAAVQQAQQMRQQAPQPQMYGGRGQIHAPPFRPQWHGWMGRGGIRR